MKKALGFLLAVCLGAALDRMLSGIPATAAAGGGQGGGNLLPPCQDINGDGLSDLSDAVFFLSWRFRGGPEPACTTQNGQPSGLPATGQTKCYGPNGAEIPCDSATCPGQDGSYAKGCPSEGRFFDHGDGTVTDNCTGLMWQKDTADVNGDGVSNDQDFLPWCDALAYCENLSFGGGVAAWDDWRLPNVRELQSIVDYGRVGPAIDPVFGALPSFYWSSTPIANVPGFAWFVYFLDGNVRQRPSTARTSHYYVRAVRSGT